MPTDAWVPRGTYVQLKRLKSLSLSGRAAQQVQTNGVKKRGSGSAAALLLPPSRCRAPAPPPRRLRGTGCTASVSWPSRATRGQQVAASMCADHLRGGEQAAGRGARHQGTPLLAEGSQKRAQPGLSVPPSHRPRMPNSPAQEAKLQAWHRQFELRLYAMIACAVRCAAVRPPLTAVGTPSGGHRPIVSRTGWFACLPLRMMSAAACTRPACIHPPAPMTAARRKRRGAPGAGCAAPACVGAGSSPATG